MPTEMQMGYLAEVGVLAIGSRLRAISEQLYSMADEVYATHQVGLEARWFPVLKTIHDRGPQSVGALATAVGLTHSSISQLASRLIRGGWITTLPGRGDRRVRELALTPKAEAALRKAKPLWHALRDELQARCDATGQNVMAAVAGLEQVIDGTMVEAVTERARHLGTGAIRIEPFRPELREHFYRLNAWWLERYFYIEEADHAVLSNPEKAILEPGGSIFFAINGDAVVGTCALMPAGDGEVELTKMGVDPEAQGLGVGRQLVEHAISYFERQGGGKLFLETNTRLEPAIRMYESVGFTHQPATRENSHYQRANVYMVWSGWPQTS
jgi:ribosomal protein S18 acetylase RimI-like enzyme/DNA-binding MarR family transcriptional regulator